MRLDQDLFRAAMRRLASSVCVVTTRTDVGPRGMTATAVMSLCAEPPTLAVSVNRSATLNPLLGEGAGFCVNVLSEDHDALARVFAGGLPADERFREGAWDCDSWQAPALSDALASFSCVVERRIELASHSLLIGAVRDIRLASPTLPLLYADGAFTGLRRRDAPPDAFNPRENSCP